MTRPRSSFLRMSLIAASALAISACTTATETAQTTAQAGQALSPEDAAQAERDAMFALFEKADKEELALSPIGAMFRGNFDQADKIGDLYTDELDAKFKALTERNIAELRSINRAALNPSDQLAYDVFLRNQNEALSGYEPSIQRVERARPINHFFGLHTFYPTFESGSSAAPFKTVKDYENAVSRHKQYGEIIDRAIGRFRHGAASGYFETKLTVGNMIEQLDTSWRSRKRSRPIGGPLANSPKPSQRLRRLRLPPITKSLSPAFMPPTRGFAII